MSDWFIRRNAALQHTNMASFFRNLFKKDPSPPATTSEPETPPAHASGRFAFGADGAPPASVPVAAPVSSPFAVASTPNPRLHTTLGVPTTSELAFTAGELINLVPPQHVRPGHTVAPNAEIPLPLNVLRAALIAGRPAILLSQLHEACPDVFLAPADDDADEIINLPPQKVRRIVDQASATPLTPPPPAAAGGIFGEAAPPPSPFGVAGSPPPSSEKTKLPPPRRRMEDDGAPTPPAALPEPLPPPLGGASPFTPFAAASPFAPLPPPEGASPFAMQQPPVDVPAPFLPPAEAPAFPPAAVSPFSVPADAPGAGSVLPPVKPASEPVLPASPFARADELPGQPPALPPVPTAAHESPFAVVPPSDVPPGIESPFARQPVHAVPEPPASIPVVSAFPLPASPFAAAEPAPVAEEPAASAFSAAEAPPHDDRTLEVPLCELLKGVWTADLGFDPALVPAALRISLPLAPLAAQLPSGRVTLPLSEVIERVDAKYRAAFSRAVPTATVPVPLHLVLAVAAPTLPQAPVAEVVATAFATPFSAMVEAELPVVPAPAAPAAPEPPASFTLPVLPPVAAELPPILPPVSAVPALPVLPSVVAPVSELPPSPFQTVPAAPVFAPLPPVDPFLTPVPAPPAAIVPTAPPAPAPEPPPAGPALPFAFGGPVDEAALAARPPVKVTLSKDFADTVASKHAENIDGPPREPAAPLTFARVKTPAQALPALDGPLPFSFGAAPAPVPSAAPPPPAPPQAETPPNPFAEAPGKLFSALPSFELPPVDDDDREPIPLESLKVPIGPTVTPPEPPAPPTAEEPVIQLSPDLPPLPFSFAPFSNPVPAVEETPAAAAVLPVETAKTEPEPLAPLAAAPALPVLSVVEPAPAAAVVAPLPALPPVLPPAEEAPAALAPAPVTPEPAPAEDAPLPFSFGAFAAPAVVPEPAPVAAPLVEDAPAAIAPEPEPEPEPEPIPVAAVTEVAVQPAPEPAKPEPAADSVLPFSFASFIAAEPAAAAVPAAPAAPAKEEATTALAPSEPAVQPQPAPAPERKPAGVSAVFEDLSFAINDDPTQLALRAIFSTDKTLRPQDLVDFSAEFPGLRSCLIMTPQAVVHSGRDAEADDVRHFREKAGGLYEKTISLVRELDPDATEQTFTLRTAKGLLSFFSHGDTCLAVLHETPNFHPGVREKLTLVARSLSGILQS